MTKDDFLTAFKSARAGDEIVYFIGENLAAAANADPDIARLRDAVWALCAPPMEFLADDHSPNVKEPASQPNDGGKDKGRLYQQVLTSGRVRTFAYVARKK